MYPHCQGRRNLDIEIKHRTALYVCLEDICVWIQERLNIITDEGPPTIFFSYVQSQWRKEFVSEHSDTVIAAIDVNFCLVRQEQNLFLICLQGIWNYISTSWSQVLTADCWPWNCLRQFGTKSVRLLRDYLKVFTAMPLCWIFFIRLLLIRISYEPLMNWNVFGNLQMFVWWRRAVKLICSHCWTTNGLKIKKKIIRKII